MLYVLGLGAATPETVIDNSLLKELNPNFDAARFETESGILARRSGMPREYLLNSKGKTPGDALAACIKTPTDLSLESAMKALEVAKIQKEQIGLLIGDCATPVQTCPSEGQRLGSKLGIKVPAYDIIASAGAFIVHLATFARWKAERCPDYVIGVTSGVVTHTIDYSKGVAGSIFGDGAASYVLSTKHTGKLKLIDCGFTTEAHHSRDLRIESYGHLHIPDSYVSEFVRPHVKETIAKLKEKYGSSFADGKFIGAQCDPVESARAAIAAGFSEKNILSNGDRCGDMLGASVPSIVAECWDLFNKGEKLFVVQSGLGIASGFLVFEVTE